MILVEGLPTDHSKLLEELLKSYPGVQTVEPQSETASRVQFSAPGQARFAQSGLHRMRVDSSGRELKVELA